MKISLFTQFGARNSVPVFEAIGVGLRRLGHTVVEHDWTADAAVIWSVLWNGRMAPNQTVFEEFQRWGRPVIVAEVGCLARERLWRLSVFDSNGQHYPEPILARRVEQLGLSYLNRGCRGANVVIALQRSDSLQWEGQPSIIAWVERVVKQIRRVSDRPIVVRPHPRQPFSAPATPDWRIELPVPIEHTYDQMDFERVLNGCRVVINHNASPGITSVLNGVPVITGPNAMTQSLAHSTSIDFNDIETDRLGDRSNDWLNQIAHTEWSVTEIAESTPLDLTLRRLPDRPLST